MLNDGYSGIINGLLGNNISIPLNIRCGGQRELPVFGLKKVHTSVALFR